MHKIEQKEVEIIDYNTKMLQDKILENNLEINKMMEQKVLIDDKNSILTAIKSLKEIEDKFAYIDCEEQYDEIMQILNDFYKESEDEDE